MSFDGGSDGLRTSPGVIERGGRDERIEPGASATEWPRRRISGDRLMPLSDGIMTELKSQPAVVMSGSDSNCWSVVDEAVTLLGWPWLYAAVERGTLADGQFEPNPLNWAGSFLELRLTDVPRGIILHNESTQ